MICARPIHDEQINIVSQARVFRAVAELNVRESHKEEFFVTCI